MASIWSSELLAIADDEANTAKCCFNRSDPMTDELFERCYLESTAVASLFPLYMYSYIGLVRIFADDVSNDVSNEAIWHKDGIFLIVCLSMAVTLNVFKLIAKTKCGGCFDWDYDPKTGFWQIIIGCRIVLCVIYFFQELDVFAYNESVSLFTVNFIICFIDQILFCVDMYSHFKIYRYPEICSQCDKLNIN